MPDTNARRTSADAHQQVLMEGRGGCFVAPDTLDGRLTADHLPYLLAMREDLGRWLAATFREIARVEGGHS